MKATSTLIVLFLLDMFAPNQDENRYFDPTQLNLLNSGSKTLVLNGPSTSVLVSTYTTNFPQICDTNVIFLLRHRHVVSYVHFSIARAM